MNRKRIVSLGLLVVAAALLVVGIITGDVVNVFRKATMICYECIGIG